jgi:molybdenum cofactor guanylyltransferase
VPAPTSSSRTSPKSMQNAISIVVLAGGRATRFPGKLEALIDGVPLLERVRRNLSEAGPVILAVHDRQPGLGPLGGLYSAALDLDCERIFLAAGDAPNLTAAVPRALLAAMEPGDEAVVPEHDGHVEPLAAIYVREAVVREAPRLLQGDDLSMRALLAQLNVRRVPLDAHHFSNVNTPEDLA